MWVRNLELRDFRNYAEQTVAFERGVMVLVGENAQGKTNLLEALGLLASGVSHREARAAHLVRRGACTARLRCLVEHVNGLAEPAAEISRAGTRTLSLGGIPCRRLEDFLGGLNVVIFHSRDVELAAGEAATRRRYLNEEVAKRRPVYLADLAGYRRCLAHRNAALRQSRGTGGLTRTIDAFGEALARHGEAVMAARAEHIAVLAPVAAAIHGRLSGGAETLNVRYLPSAEPGTLRDLLDSRRRDELERGMTLVGPHRDEVVLEVNGAPVRRMGSRGQQKTAAIALKLAGAYLDGADPAVPLLDDILAELDPGRRTRLASELSVFEQVFVAATTRLDVPDGILDGARVHNVCEGTIRAATTR